MFKLIIPLLFSIILLNPVDATTPDPDTATINELIKSLDITLSKKTLIIRTQCQGIPVDSEIIPLPKCDSKRILATRVKNNPNINKTNLCKELQSTFSAVKKDCKAYCIPCSFKYTT